MREDLILLKALNKAAKKEEIRAQLAAYREKVLQSDLDDKQKAKLVARIQELLNIA
jgi:exopolyphosphatase/pppGpp-phosphohydrolase